MPGYYAGSLDAFLEISPTELLGTLVAANADERFIRLEHAQTVAWRDEIDLLRSFGGEVIARTTGAKEWGIVLEFPIPRRQKRADVILLADGVIFVLELKASTIDAAAFSQLEDYAFDLRDFHAGSRNRRIVPVAVAATVPVRPRTVAADDLVTPPVASTPTELADSVLKALREFADPARPIDLRIWDAAPYHPVPTIVEAALAIFSGMEVREIAQAACEPHNLTETVDTIVDAVAEARTANHKIVCFVTGVPGSGKTLAGLKAVHDKRTTEKAGTDPAFFSGNAPLVKILREALVQDLAQRSEKISRVELRRRVSTLIQNVHVFARTYWDDPEQPAPHEKVIVFDEAQRAWNAERNRRKFKRDISEPEMLLGVMDRHKDWAVVVCLVGGGQEIHLGEAGLAAWGEALRKLEHWRVRASREALLGGSGLAGQSLFGDTPPMDRVTESASLHLPVSTRSYRAEAVTSWVDALLSGEPERAAEFADKSPVWITRDLAAGRAWLRRVARGSSRCGLVTSSGATRLRAYGIETATAFHRDYPYAYWFLNGREDVRSSYQLEVAATEFEIQGLELDWIGLCWGGDLIWDGGWRSRRFAGKKWRLKHNPVEHQYSLNSYRVLLTRSRQGLVVWIPPGNPDDPTVAPREFDEVADVLQRAGARRLEEATEEP